MTYDAITLASSAACLTMWRRAIGLLVVHRLVGVGSVRIDPAFDAVRVAHHVLLPTLYVKATHIITMACIAMPRDILTKHDLPSPPINQELRTWMQL